MKNNKQFLRETISQCTKIDINQIDSSTSISNNAEWDSLAHMQILSILSEEYSFEITSELIMNLSSFEVIHKYLNSLKNS